MLSLAHRPGHLGRDRTVRRVMEEFYWPGVYEVSKLCRACLECQRANKHHLPPVPLQPLPIIDTPFKRIGMDMTGPLPTTAEGNRYVLVSIDYATRWPEAIALRTTESTTIADQLMILFNRTGIPEEILTDCGRNFISRLMTELYKLLGVKRYQNYTLSSSLRRACGTVQLNVEIDDQEDTQGLAWEMGLSHTIPTRRV